MSAAIGDTSVSTIYIFIDITESGNPIVLCTHLSNDRTEMDRNLSATFSQPIHWFFTCNQSGFDLLKAFLFYSVEYRTRPNSCSLPKSSRPNSGVHWVNVTTSITLPILSTSLGLQVVVLLGHDNATRPPYSRRLVWPIEFIHRICPNTNVAKPLKVWTNELKNEKHYRN